jgi:hypothetical protein
MEGEAGSGIHEKNFVHSGHHKKGNQKEIGVTMPPHVNRNVDDPLVKYTSSPSLRTLRAALQEEEMRVVSIFVHYF